MERSTVLKLIILFLLLIIIAGILFDFGRSYTIRGGAEDDKMQDVERRITLDKEWIDIILSSKDAPVEVTLDDIKYRKKFIPAAGNVRNGTHLGQRKLFISELLFMTMIPQEPSPLVVYAGSNPSNKIYILRMLYPNTSFLLVDPREALIMTDLKQKKRINHYEYNPGDIFYIYSNNTRTFELHKPKKIRVIGTGEDIIYDNWKPTPPKDLKCLASIGPGIYIYQDLMTNELAEMIHEGANGRPIYYLSDIRSNTNPDGAPFDKDVINDQIIEIETTQRMKPQLYMHKYRIPYEIVEECYKEHYESMKRGKLLFLEGKRYLQAWAPRASTELRVIGSSGKVVEYDISEHEDKLNYFNVYDRGMIHHYNPLAEFLHELGFCHCADCALEVWTWQQTKLSNDDIYKYAELLLWATGSVKLCHRYIDHPLDLEQIKIRMMSDKIRTIDC